MYQYEVYTRQVNTPRLFTQQFDNLTKLKSIDLDSFQKVNIFEVNIDANQAEVNQIIE